MKNLTKDMSELQKAFEKVNMDSVTNWYLIKTLRTLAQEIYSGRIKKIDCRGYENILLEAAKRFDECTKALHGENDALGNAVADKDEGIESLEVVEEESEEQTLEAQKTEFVAKLEEAFQTGATKSRPHSYPHLVISNLLVSLKRLERENPFDDYDPDERSPYGLVIVSNLSFKESIIIPSLELGLPTLFLKVMHCESLDHANELIQTIKPTKKLTATAGLKDDTLAYMVLDHKIARNITHERIDLIRPDLYLNAQNEIKSQK